VLSTRAPEDGLIESTPTGGMTINFAPTDDSADARFTVKNEQSGTKSSGKSHSSETSLTTPASDVLTTSKGMLQRELYEKKHFL
jgi:hypothetical protein